MVLGVKPMACGNCGHGLFRMFYSGPRPEKGLMAECDKCKSVSTIGVTQPEIEIGWGQAAEGILCQMEPTSP